MRSYDLSPLFRSTVGFDRLSRLMDSALSAQEQAPAYPPYNIERTGEDTYRISMAVAGFGEDDINITVQENGLTISGKLVKEESEPSFLYRGIAGRAFERRFELAEHIKVKDASLRNGLLHVDLVREVPEAAKPRSVKISPSGTLAGDKAQPKVIDSKAA